MLYSKDFIIAIVFIFATMLLRIITIGYWNSGVLSIMEMYMASVEFVVVTSFASLGYARCFIEDFENKNVYSQVIRKGIFPYTVSKIITIIISVFAIIIAELLCCAFFLRITGHPWQTVYDDSAHQQWVLYPIIEKGHFVLFIIAAAAQYSILASIVCLVSAWISLYISNKMIVTAIPALLTYIMKFYLTNIFGYNGMNVFQLFCAVNNYTEYGTGYLERCTWLGICSWAFMTCLIYCTIRRKIQHG
jgi:hypothetical protein